MCVTALVVRIELSLSSCLVVSLDLGAQVFAQVSFFPLNMSGICTFLYKNNVRTGAVFSEKTSTWFCQELASRAKAGVF